MRFLQGGGFFLTRSIRAPHRCSQDSYKFYHSPYSQYTFNHTGVNKAIFSSNTPDHHPVMVKMTNKVSPVSFFPPSPWSRTDCLLLYSEFFNWLSAVTCRGRSGNSGLAVVVMTEGEVLKTCWEKYVTCSGETGNKSQGTSVCFYLF